MNRIYASVLCLVGCCLFACATSNQPQSANSTGVHQSPPPTDLDLTITDRKPVRHENPFPNEEDQYRHSLAYIREVFETEGLNYQVCLKVYSQSKCRQIFCTIDELVDSKGRWHLKPYCR